MEYILPFLLCIVGVASLRLEINPRHFDAGTSGSTFSVKCSSNEPLTRCQFKWRDIYNNDGPLMDLSEGVKTPIATNYSYSGTGLEKGDCGINLNRPPGVHRWIVCCRVRSKDSGWHYAHMTLFAHSKSSTSLTTSPQQITVQKGENATITCNLKDPLAGCVFRIPDGSYLNFNSGPRSPSTSSYRYFGSGLNSGECGISLFGVTTSSNGFLWCQAWKNTTDEWRSFALTISDSPSIPVLEVKPSNYSEGDFLTIQCTVTNALPVANLTWYKNTSVIRQDHVNEAYTEPWVWPFQRQTIKQTMTLKLTHSDDGKEIKCKIKQSDSGPEVQNSYTIAFYRGYKVPDSVVLTVASKKLIEGKILSAKCTVNGGSPRPEIKWFLGSKNLTGEIFTLDTGKFTESVSMIVQGEDNGQMLKCVVFHPLYSSPNEKVSIINVEYAPKLAQKTGEQFKFKVGSPGIATVEIISNPKPTVYWTIDEVSLQEGAADSTGCYEAAYLMKNVNNPNVWVAQLYINNVTWRDFKTNFFLNARNGYGEEYFRCSNFSATEQADVSQPKVKTSGNNLSDGSWVKATCEISTNRPVATIKWSLSNVTLTEGIQNPIFSTDLQGKHQISQSILFQVREKDDGNQLTCTSRNKQAKLNISVMYAPKKLIPTIKLYGYEVSKPGVVSVEISANPRPSIMWEVGGVIVLEDDSASDKRFHAPAAIPVVRGKWHAKLFITNITQQDVDSDFALTARNQAGSRTYHVRLLTNQPPEPNIPDETSSGEINLPSPVTLSKAKEQTVIEENLTLSTISDTGKTSTAFYYTTETVSVYGQVAVPQERQFIYENVTYSYLSIGNSIAIVALCILGSLVYHRLTRRLLLARQGNEHAPLCLDNLYYDQVHHPERQPTNSE